MINRKEKKSIDIRVVKPYFSFYEEKTI